MKKPRIITLIILTLCLYSASNTAFGQSFYKKKYEKRESISFSFTGLRSIRGWQKGVNISYKTRSDFEIGLFSYQDNGTRELPANKFEGIEVGFPLLRLSEKLQIKSNIRFGAHNRRFIALLPMLDLTRSIGEVFEISGSFGFSERYPVFGIGISTKILTSNRF